MKNWSLNAKIMLIVLILSAGGMATSYLGLNKMSYIKSLLTEISGVLVRRDQLTSLVLDQQRQLAILNRELIIERKIERMILIERKIAPAETEMFRLLDEYSSIASPEGKEIAKKYKDVFNSWISVNAKLREYGKKNMDAEVSTLTEKEENPLRMKALELLKEMNALTAKRLQDATQASEDAYVMAHRFVLIVSILVIVSGMSLAFFVMRAVSRSIDQVIRSLDDNSNQVSSAAQQVASSAEQLSQAATEQASSLEETASAIEELSSMVQKNTENANKSTDVSNQSEKSATKGKKVVEEMIAAIESINSSNNNIMQQINHSNAQISEIVKVISEIGNKTKVINDIVFQTKLLSFNASVEAARAGEHGKGFAVVAEEVGNLAQMSGNAAKEISSMLDGSIQKVEGIVNETKSKVETLITEGKEKVETGTHVAQQCGEVLDEIVSNVSNVAQMMTEIAASSREQSQGVQEITKAMGQLDQVTQENAATSEEAASAAEELSSQADSLRGTINTLIETIKGNNNQGVHQHESQDSSSANISQNKEAQRLTSQAHHSNANGSSKVVHLQRAMNKMGIDKKTAEKGVGQDPVISNGNGTGKKKVVGLENGLIPSEEDPRFKDV